MQADYSAVWLPIVFLIAGVVSCISSVIGANVATFESVYRMSSITSIVLVLMACASALTFLLEAPYLHMCWHTIVLIFFSSLHPAPPVLLNTVLVQKGDDDILFDQYVAIRYLGRGLGIFLAWFQFIYLFTAPYWLLLTIILFVQQYVNKTHTTFKHFNK
jgi:hypothetical protein